MELESDSIVVATDLGSGNLETIGSNGSCKNDEEIVDNSLKNGLNSTTTENFRSSGGAGDAVRDADAVNTDANANKPSSTPPPKKGYGLKKWRRIKRNDHVGVAKTDTDTDTDTGKEKEKEKEYDSDSTGRMLKRGSANLLNENDKEGSWNSVKTNNTTIMAAAASNAAFVVPATPTFNAGADSDNSEDSHAHSHRSSSKSSTAATTKLRSSAKHRSQVPKPQPQVVVSADTSKKSKGGLELDFERENSPLSSMDSDSICSNSVFLRGSCDPASNSVPHPPPDSSDQVQHSPPASTADAAVHSPDSSDQLSSTAANHKDHQLPDGDPLVESIMMLQSAQLALQAEVQKFGEIGKGICSLCDDSNKTSGIPASMTVDCASDAFSESNHVYLSKIIQTLERQLDEAKGSLKEKELKIAEHEAAMRNLESSQDPARSAIEQESKRCIEMEAELQDLFKKKLEAEVQSAVITRSTKDFSVLVEDWIKLMGDQKSISTEPTQSPRMVINAENKAVLQQGQAEKLDTHNTGIADGEESLKMRRGIVKFSICLSIQLVLLVFVFTVFVLQLGPKSTVVVPT